MDKLAYQNKTFPDYIDGDAVIFKNKEWKKDPLQSLVNINKKYIGKYLVYIISKNFEKWKRQDGWEQLKDFAPQIISSNINNGIDNIDASLIENLLQNCDHNLDGYKIKLEYFNKLYSQNKKIKLKKSKLKLEELLPRQIRQSAIFKTEIKDLMYHFNNIILGDFSFALFDNYVKITPYLKDETLITGEDKSNEYILLSNNTTKFYISLCKTGILVEFDYNYYVKTDEGKKSKCNFIDQPVNIIDKNKILNRIGEILQIKTFQKLPEDYTQASFQIKFQNINKNIWAYLAINNKIFSTYITVPELRISKLNNRFFFKFLNVKETKKKCKSYLELKNKKLNFGDITANYINIDDNIIEIFVSRSLGKNSIKKFQKKLLALLEFHYAPNVAKITKLYANYGIKLQKNKTITKKKKLLKNMYPGYFNIGYSTNCGPKKQPAIITEKQMKQLIKKKIDPNLILKAPASPKDKQRIIKGGYPEIKNYTNSQGFRSLYFVCNKRNIHNYIPAEFKNKYPRLNIDQCPCCKTKEKFATKVKSETTSYTKGNAICSGICALSPLLLNIFLILDPTKEYHRQSATPNILNLLNAVFNKNFTKKDIGNYRFPGVAKQENWDINDIKKFINEQKYIDPSRCIRILEEIYNCKLFIFHRKHAVSRNIIKDREIPSLLIPRHNYYTNYYTWNISDRRMVILYAHFGTSAHTVTDPHYEIITQTDWAEKTHKSIFNSNDIIIRSLYKLQNMINESFCLTRELEPFDQLKWVRGKQVIDYYGKCRGIVINNLSLLFDPRPPLNLPYINLHDIVYETQEKVLIKCKELGIKIIKKSPNVIKGIYKNLTVLIPVRVENINKFNENRLNAKFIIAWTFYLFSHYWHETGTNNIDKFLRNKIHVKSNIKYNFKDIIFDKGVSKLYVQNAQIKKKLHFVLYQKLIKDGDRLALYYKNTIIPDFFSEIRDFTSHNNEIILYRDEIRKDEFSNLLLRFNDEQLDTMSPYFVEHDKKLWIYQNCQNKKIKKSIEKTWKKNGYNNIKIIDKKSSKKILAKLEI